MSQPAKRRLTSLLRSLPTPPHNLAPAPRYASSTPTLSTLLPPAPILPSSLHPILPNPRFSNPATHTHINHPTRLYPNGESEVPELLGGDNAKDLMQIVEATTGLDGDAQMGLFKSTVVMKRVSNMTKKGKMGSFYCQVIVGHPTKHLVSLSSARGLTAPSAIASATHSALLTLSPVQLLHGRTFPGTGKELRSKWGSTEVIFRGRPAGFGLMVPPVLHPLLRAAGVRDGSATIRGSRNPMQVLKAAMQILHGGAGLPGYAPSLTKRLARHNKGTGMRGVEEVERERGRFGVEVGRRL